MAERKVVYAHCPLCSWRSEPSAIRNEPNAEWYARSRAAGGWRDHFDRNHRPDPNFVTESLFGGTRA